MVKSKYYSLLSGLLDNELSEKQKLKTIRLLKDNQWLKEEYEKLKQLKKITNSTKLTNPLPNNFNSNLMNKIYDYQCKENWLNRLINRGFFTKVSYAMVSASLLFIIFLGVKIYIYEPNITNESTSSGNIEKSGVPVVLDGPNYTTKVPRLPSFPSNKSSSTSQTNNIMITVEGSNLILSIENDSIIVNINTGEIISKIDKKKKDKFKVVLDNKLKKLLITYKKN